MRRRPRTSASSAFVLCGLALVAGCGEDVLIGNWQLRSLRDAGIDLPREADAGPNEQNVQAADARNHRKVNDEQKGQNDENGQSDHDDNRSGGDKNH